MELHTAIILKWSPEGEGFLKSQEATLTMIGGHEFPECKNGRKDFSLTWVTFAGLER